MNKRFHVVGITTKKYRRISSFKTFAEAARLVCEQNFRSFCVVLRDGNTGKRYSKADVLKVAAQ